MSSELVVYHLKLSDLLKPYFSLVWFEGCLSGLIQGESITIPQLVQIWTNADHMEKSIVSLEIFIAKTTK